MAATMICHITPDYFRKENGEVSLTLLQQRYLVPQAQLIDYLIYDITESESDNALQSQASDAQ